MNQLHAILLISLQQLQLQLSPTRSKTYLWIKTITKFRDTGRNFIKVDRFTATTALDNIHGHDEWGGEITIATTTMVATLALLWCDECGGKFGLNKNGGVQKKRGSIMKLVYYNYV